MIDQYDDPEPEPGAGPAGPPRPDAGTRPVPPPPAAVPAPPSANAPAPPGATAPSGPEIDPFAGLEEWGREAERRVRRSYRAGRLHRALTAPLRAPRWLMGLPARQRVRSARRGPRRFGRTLAVLLTVGVLLGSGYAYHRFYAGSGTARSYPTSSPPAGITVTTSATAKPTDPFDDTPAATYAAGAAGFVLPPATALAPFTKVQVQTALDQVRAALIAAYVDRTTLVDHRADALAKAVAPAEHDHVARQFRDPRSGAIAVLISRVVTLDSQDPRVEGRTTLAIDRDQDGRSFLAITTNYVVVYPFRPDRARHRLAIVHGEIVFAVYRPTQVTTASRGLWVHSARSYYAGMDCVEMDKGLLAPARLSQTPGPSASPDGDPNSVYDPNRSLDVSDDC